MIAGWESLDPKAVAACFLPDGVWHNMPYPPTEGRDRIETAAAGFLGAMATCRFEILNMAEIAPGTVVTERVDIFGKPGAPELHLPVMGIFELEESGIRVWRDYFDSAPFAAA